MGIERLYADGIEQAYQRGLRSPAPAPDLDFRTGSFLAAGFGGLATGLLEQGASFLEGVASFQRYSDQRRAEMGARVPDPERKAEVQRGLEAAGRAARMRAQESTADPQTTHMADQVFHGLTRFGVKAVGSVVAAGPVGGAALLGAEETNTIYRDLTARGIDSETALKVAAVQGAISAAGVVLPVSGAGLATTTAGKVGATAALVGVGGPGAYVAQETLARDILQRAGYADEAAKHDPADLLGLGISTVLPGAFGAVALRGALRSTKAMPAVRTEAGVRDAVQLTPEEQAASDAYERSAGNLAELRKEIARQKDPAARQVLEAELAKQTEAAAKAGQGAMAEMAARSPDVVDAARVKVLQETVRRSLPESPDAYPRLMEAIDDVAAGRTPRVPDFMPPAERAAEMAPAAQSTPVTRLDRQTDGKGGGVFAILGPDGRDVGSISTFVRNATQNGEPIEVVQLRTIGIDDPAARGLGLGVRAYQEIIDQALAAGRVFWSDTSVSADAQRVYQALDRRGYIVEKNPARPPEADADGTLSTRGSFVYRITGRKTESSVAASGQQDRPSIPDAPTTPQTANPEAAAPARGAGTDAPPGAADAGRPAADVQAAGVARTVADQERQIVDALAAERPDMMVTLPGTNEAIRLGDAVEMIRAQQALGESDADLVRAAVLCDLSP